MSGQLSLFAPSEVERGTTSEYPTRYAAFARPRVLVEFDGDEPSPGEVAVYCDVRPNPAWCGLTDGVYVEVRTMPQGPRYLVDASGSRTDWTRAQTVRTARREDRGEAMALALGLIAEMSTFAFAESPVLRVLRLPTARGHVGVRARGASSPLCARLAP